MMEEMKKYITPEVVIIGLETEGLLAYSSGMNDDPAEDPAKGRLWDDFYDDEW